MRKIFLWIFFKNFGCVFFKLKHAFGHISGMVGPIDMKWKGSTSVGYWVYYMTLIVDIGCLKVKFLNNCISGIVGLIDLKWKASESMGYWANFMALPFDHTHELELEVSRSDFEIVLSQWWDGWLTWNKKDVSRPLMTTILTLVLPWLGVWMYRIVTGVTSDVSMPSTYLVAGMVSA